MTSEGKGTKEKVLGFSLMCDAGFTLKGFSKYVLHVYLAI